MAVSSSSSLFVFVAHRHCRRRRPRHLSASARRATAPVGNRRRHAAPILAGGLPRRLGPSSPPSHPQSPRRLPRLQPRRRIPSPCAAVSCHVGTPPALASSALQPGQRQAWYEPRILFPSILFFLAKSLTLTFSDLIWYSDVAFRCSHLGSRIVEISQDLLVDYLWVFNLRLIMLFTICIPNRGSIFMLLHRIVIHTSKFVIHIY